MLFLSALKERPQTKQQKSHEARRHNMPKVQCEGNLRKYSSSGSCQHCGTSVRWRTLLPALEREPSNSTEVFLLRAPVLSPLTVGQDRVCLVLGHHHRRGAAMDACTRGMKRESLTPIRIQFSLGRTGSTSSSPGAIKTNPFRKSNV